MKKHNAKTSPRFSGIGDIRPEDFYWLIGILEGEGCFGITPARRYKNSVYRYPKIALQMTDEDIVARVAKLLNTTYSFGPRQKPHKNIFHCSISGARAAEAMQTMREFMGKRRQAKIGNYILDSRNGLG